MRQGNIQIVNHRGDPLAVLFNMPVPPVDTPTDSARDEHRNTIQEAMYDLFDELGISHMVIKVQYCDEEVAS